MHTQEIQIGEAVYELGRVYAGTDAVASLIREMLEANAASIDAGKPGAV